MKFVDCKLDLEDMTAKQVQEICDVLPIFDEALENGALELMPTKDKRTGKRATILVYRRDDMNVIPLARLIGDAEFEDLDPPEPCCQDPDCDCKQRYEAYLRSRS